MNAIDKEALAAIALQYGGGGERQPERLTAIFIDFDNVYISLLNRDKRAAMRFASDPAGWTAALLDGSLSTRSLENGASKPRKRRIISRVYGNPVPTRDRTAFANVRNYFMQAGYEVIDCPPLTNQLKNGSDIKMVLDMRDFLDHQPQIDEFIILSGDSDFAPILLRLRAHNRRTTIYAGVQTARSYISLADEIITDEALIAFLNRRPIAAIPANDANGAGLDNAAISREIIAEAEKIISEAGEPIGMETLASRIRKRLGNDKTLGTRWGGNGQFSILLTRGLGENFAISDKPPYTIWRRDLHQAPQAAENDSKDKKPGKVQATNLLIDANTPVNQVIDAILQQTSIPALSASYYHRLFQLIGEELAENGFVYQETASRVAARGKKRKLPVHPDHVQQILHRIRRSGHWFSKDDSKEMLGRVFRDSVVEECESEGMKFTPSQCEAIDRWFIAANEDGARPPADVDSGAETKGEDDEAAPVSA